MRVGGDASVIRRCIALRARGSPHVSEREPHAKLAGFTRRYDAPRFVSARNPRAVADSHFTHSSPGSGVPGATSCSLWCVSAGGPRSAGSFPG